MSTELTVIVTINSSDNNYQDNPEHFIAMDLVNDYLIWTKGSDAVKEGQDAPTESELNEASTVIDPDNPVTVGKCLILDKSLEAGTLREIDNMGANKKYVFGFSFDGATANEPQLEVWDNTDHDSTAFHVLGNGTPANSMVKGICTTYDLPGEGWAGDALAGDSNVLLLNDGHGALDELPTGISSQELYANLKIVIPAGYSTPGVEPFIFTVRYLWN